MTHRDRLRWLADFGWTMDAKMGVVPVKDIPGRWCWLDGPDNKTVYLRESDGSGILLGGPRDVLTWEQLQDWVTGKPAEVKKPLAGQRSLFGDE